MTWETTIDRYHSVRRDFSSEVSRTAPAIDAAIGGLRKGELTFVLRSRKAFKVMDVDEAQRQPWQPPQLLPS